jgi:hypothetical protein
MDEVSNSSSSSEQAQINRIKDITYCSKEAMIQMGAIDALGVYGKLAIDAINELINCPSIDRKVKAHAQSVIESIKNSS